MNIGWPQGIWLLLLVLGIGIDLARHGQPKKPGKHDAISTIIASGLIFLLLWWGGFFSG